MSIENFFKDVVTGNFSNAWRRFLDFLGNYLPPWLVSFIDKAGTAEGKILAGLVEIAVPDLIKNGLTTDGFVQTAKDIFSQLASQNISTFTLQDVFAMLNTKVSAQAPTASLSAPAPAAVT